MNTTWICFWTLRFYTERKRYDHKIVVCMLLTTLTLLFFIGSSSDHVLFEFFVLYGFRLHLGRKCFIQISIVMEVYVLISLRSSGVLP